jgi:Tfp pilus assembly protein PilN
LLIFFASLIFINLGLFFYLSGENSDLGAKNSTVLADIKRIEDLEKELKLKEKFLREAGWIKSSQTSLYADQVAKTVPNTVLLKELSVHPTNQTASRKDKRMVFETGIILISGTCKDPVVLNPWLVELKKLNWVKTAVSKKYQYDHKKRIGYFELELSVDAKIISRI